MKWVMLAFALVILAACQPSAPPCQDGLVLIGETCCADSDADGKCDPLKVTLGCSDGLQNQGENGVDCGGVCGGFWYDGICHVTPKELPSLSIDPACNATVSFNGNCEKLCTGYEFDLTGGHCMERQGSCCTVTSPFTSLAECQSFCEVSCFTAADCPPGRLCEAGACVALPPANCVDGLLNQDESHIDCGGVCGGYWHNETCLATEPPQCSADTECRLLNSTCDCIGVPNFDLRQTYEGGATSCAQNLCAEKKFVARCIKGNCTAATAPVIGHSVKLVDIQFANQSHHLIRISKLVFEFDARGPGNLDWEGKVFVYQDDNDQFSKSQQGPDLLPPPISHGSVSTQSIGIQMIPYDIRDGPRIVRVEWYDARTHAYVTSNYDVVTLERFLASR